MQESRLGQMTSLLYKSSRNDESMQRKGKGSKRQLEVPLDEERRDKGAYPLSSTTFLVFDTTVYCE